MGSDDRGCCDKCAKTFIMGINILIILIGGAILAGGVYYQLNDTSYYKELVNHDIFNVPIIMMVIGGLLLLVGISGFIGACAEIMILLKLYMGFLIIIMLVQIIIAVGCVAMQSSVETYATNRTMELIGYYGTDVDEDGIIKATIDAVQENFDCCGVVGPSDWSDNSVYGGNSSTPTSCCKTQYRTDSTCGYAVYSTNNKINDSGCKTSLLNWIESNLLYVGIFAGVICLLQCSTVLPLLCLTRSHLKHAQHDHPYSRRRGKNNKIIPIENGYIILYGR